MILHVKGAKSKSRKSNSPRKRVRGEQQTEEPKSLTLTVADRGSGGHTLPCPDGLLRRI